MATLGPKTRSVGFYLVSSSHLYLKTTGNGQTSLTCHSKSSMLSPQFTFWLSCPPVPIVTPIQFLFPEHRPAFLSHSLAQGLLPQAASLTPTDPSSVSVVVAAVAAANTFESTCFSLITNTL